MKKLKVLCTFCVMYITDATGIKPNWWDHYSMSLYFLLTLSLHTQTHTHSISFHSTVLNVHRFFSLPCLLHNPGCSVAWGRVTGVNINKIFPRKRSERKRALIATFQILCRHRFPQPHTHRRRSNSGEMIVAKRLLWGSFNLVKKFGEKLREVCVPAVQGHRDCRRWTFSTLHTSHTFFSREPCTDGVLCFLCTHILSEFSGSVHNLLISLVCSKCLSTSLANILHNVTFTVDKLEQPRDVVSEVYFYLKLLLHWPTGKQA